MKRALPLFAVIAIVLAGCGSSARPRACDPALERGLRAWAHAGFSGSLALLTDGKPACVVAYGMADRDARVANTPRTVFSIGSITKAFTAAAIVGLADAGKLSLDDRAGALLPALRGPVADATIRDLLLHTSGLKGSHGADHRAMSARQALAAIGRLDLAFKPGARFLYSNAGYTLLALIVERVSGTSFRDYVRAHVLRGGGFWDGAPAAHGPRAVGYLDDGTPGHRGGFAGPHWAIEGNGGLAMTMRDLAAWTHALFGGRIVSPAAVRTLTTPGVRAAPGRAETPGWVALDADAFGQRVLATAGGGGDVGHNAIVVWLPRSRRALAVASNTAKISAEQLVETIGPALLGGEPLPLPRPRAAASPRTRESLRGLAGRYGPFRVTVRGDRLAVAASGARAVAALLPPPDDVAPADITAHERRVLALLGGAGSDGAKERRALTSSLGAITRVRVDGTVVTHGELRTYVTVRGARGAARLWYAVNDEGAIAGAEGPATLPTATLVATGDGRFRPDDPTAAGPGVTVSFRGDRLLVAGPGGELSATRR